MQTRRTEGLGGESEEKREPVSDIDTALVDSLKVLDPDGRLEKPTYAAQQIALYSITSSARASRDGGTSRPSDLAVLMLMASWYLVAACTGKSAVFSPLRIRST